MTFSAERHPDAAAYRVHVGARIKDWRSLRRVTQVQLAAALSVDQGTVSRWERGLTSMTVMEVYRVAMTLHVEPRALLPWVRL